MSFLEVACTRVRVILGFVQASVSIGSLGLVCTNLQVAGIDRGRTGGSELKSGCGSSLHVSSHKWTRDFLLRGRPS